MWIRLLSRSQGRNLRLTDDGLLGEGDKRGWEEPIPAEQAQWQAKELGEWLSQAVGSPVKVWPIIALPGWFIEKIGNRIVPVINPAKSHSFFLQQSGDRLTPERITQIAWQLDRVCRDVPPPNKGE